MSQTSPSRITYEGERIECSFDPEVAKKYGISVEVSNGRLYALCPICNQPWGKGWWKLINDARKCCSNRDIEEEEKERTELNKERAVLLKTSMLMKPNYAIVSKSRSKAEAWIKFNEIDPKRVIFLEDKIAIKHVLNNLKSYDIFFLGKRNNYLTHTALNHPQVMQELEDQESSRKHQFIALYSDSGSAQAQPKTLIIPIASREQFKRFKKQIEEDNKKLLNPINNIKVILFIRKGSLVDLEVFSLEDST